MRDRVTVLAPAKLNLALDVVGILPGGYHALDMTMQAISLYERVVIHRSPYLDLTLPGSKVKPGPGNTAIKAALAFFHYTGLLAGADITIYKNVPVRAGMAGGSADAAAVLVGLNELYGARLSMSELCALGAGIGADVPFALMGGTCRVQGLGDLIKALPPMPECWFTVVMPDYGVSTPEAFAAYDKVGAASTPTAPPRKPPSGRATWTLSAPLPETLSRSAAGPRTTRPSRPPSGRMGPSPPL